MIYSMRQKHALSKLLFILPLLRPTREPTMTSNRLFTLVFTLTFASFSVSVRAADIVVSKESWLSGMRNILPASFCKDGTYFRECFETSTTVCHSTATEATESCLRQFESEIPKLLQQPNDGSFWGARVGVCAGTLFEGSLKQYRVNSAKCNDPAQWK